MPASPHGLNSSVPGSGRHDLPAPAERSTSHDRAVAPSTDPPTAVSSSSASGTAPSTSDRATHRADHTPSVQQSLSSFARLSMSGSQPPVPPNGSGAHRMGSNPAPSPMTMASSRSHSYSRGAAAGDELLSPPGYAPSAASAHSAYGPPGAEPHRGAGGGGLPGSLQAGRPGTGASSAGGVPILPPIATQGPQPPQQQPGYGGRPTGSSHSHAYSRSSPAAGSFPDEGKYAAAAATPTHGRGGGAHAPTPQTAYSPLGLADIRAHTADAGAFEGGPGSALAYGDAEAEPANSQYLAPWPVYSFDWCKWPVAPHHTESAGKLAIGSYLEDSHNYVSPPTLRTHEPCLLWPDADMMC